MSKISISELETAERELPRDWRYDHQGYIESMCRTLDHTGGETEVLVLGARNEHSDGEGIVALRNAAPALIAIVKAALALREQERETARIRFEHSRRSWMSDSDYVAIATADARLVNCQDAFDEALKAVSP